MEKEFKEISHYVHAYHIKDLHSNLKKSKNQMIEEFGKHDLSQPIDDYKHIVNEREVKRNNITLELEPIGTNLQILFRYLIEKYFFIEGEAVISKAGCYVQTDIDFKSIFHHHYLDGGGIVGVTYIDPPSKEEGGGIEFNMANTNPTFPFIVYPKPNYFYLFPSWALHRPLPQNSKVKRISLNIGCTTTYKPIHKITRAIW